MRTADFGAKFIEVSQSQMVMIQITPLYFSRTLENVLVKSMK